MSGESIWNLDSILEIIKKSTNYSDVLRTLELPPNRGNRQTLQNYINKNKISIDHFSTKSLKTVLKVKLTIDDLCENSTRSSHSIRRFVKTNKLIDCTKCTICNQPSTWNGNTLTLQLDHINGNRFDNRIENLRFICPNCHSQTETFGNKRRSPKILKINPCDLCGLPCKGKVSKYCMRCSNKVNNPIKFQVSKEELTNLLDEYPMTKIGEIFNVSDNAVRKRCKKLNIDIPLSRRRNKIKEADGGTRTHDISSLED